MRLRLLELAGAEERGGFRARPETCDGALELPGATYGVAFCEKSKWYALRDNGWGVPVRNANSRGSYLAGVLDWA